MNAKTVSQEHLIHWLEEYEAPFPQIAAALYFRAKGLDRKLQRLLDDIAELAGQTMWGRTTEDENILICICLFGEDPSTGEAFEDGEGWTPEGEHQGDLPGDDWKN